MFFITNAYGMVSEDNLHADSLAVYFFASSACEDCVELKEHFIPQLLEKYGPRVSFQYFSVDDSEEFELLLLYENAYSVNTDSVVQIFVGRQYLTGIKAIKESLEAVIKKELEDGAQTLSPEKIRSVGQKQKDVVVKEKFLCLRPAIVAAAGLVDGINPCAFVTMIFFISVLSLFGKKKREILLVGAIFSFAVFLTYLMLGFGILHAIKIASVRWGISRGISLVMGLGAFILGGFSLFDVVRYRKSRNAKEMTLKLPAGIRKNINRLISNKMRTGHIVLSAFGLGIIVSLLESICTGQIYLPTIAYVLQSRSYGPRAVFYLILYNLMFIIPLLFVFIVAYMGISSRHISGFFTKHIVAAKILTAIMFFLLGFFLVIKVFNLRV